MRSVDFKKSRKIFAATIAVCDSKMKINSIKNNNDDIITISDDVIMVSSSSDDSDCNIGGIISISSESDDKIITVSSGSSDCENAIVVSDISVVCAKSDAEKNNYVKSICIESVISEGEKKRC